MKYLLLIYTNEAEHAKWSKEMLDKEMADYYAFTEEVRKRGILDGGEALHPITSATTVRVRNGKTMTTDGPFAETKEQLGGYYLLDCKNLDEAIEWAAKIPNSKDGSIEIRPIVVFEQQGQA